MDSFCVGKRLITILFIWVFLTDCAMVRGAEKNAKESISFSSETDNYRSNSVAIVDSKADFAEKVENGDIERFATDELEGTIINIKEDGCIYLAFQYLGDDGSPCVTFCENINGHEAFDTFYQRIWNENFWYGRYVYMVYPVFAGDSYWLTVNYDQVDTYIGFTPKKNAFAIKNVENKKSGSVEVTFNANVPDGMDCVIGYASGNRTSLSKRDYNAPSYYMTIDDGKITLPSAGGYTLFILFTEGNDINYRGIAYINTNDFEKMVEIVEEPISLLNKTNVVVGFAEPDAKVYVTYKSKTYSAVANNRGVYKVLLSKKLSKGKKVTIWQEISGTVSKKIEYKVTTK